MERVSGSSRSPAARGSCPRTVCRYSVRYSSSANAVELMARTPTAAPVVVIFRNTAPGSMGSRRVRSTRTNAVIDTADRTKPLTTGALSQPSSLARSRAKDRAPSAVPKVRKPGQSIRPAL